MSSLFSEETKRRLELDLINQLCVPPNLEPESPRQRRERLISPGDLFSVLYGKTQPQQVNMKTPAIQGTCQFMATEGTQTVCNFCLAIKPEECPLHRQPTGMQTGKALPYARKSLPPECKLCPSSVGGGEFGVYTNQNIPLGTWIGPYEGRRIRPCDVTTNMDTSHMWEIYEGTTLSHYIDGSDENTASWMRFIRCARHQEEQNLFAFQYNGNIYYRAFKDITFGTELLVWYDENYPMYMGIPLGIQIDAVYTTSSTPITVPQEKKQGDSNQTHQYSRSLKSATSSSENCLSNTPTQTKAAVRSYQDPRISPTSHKNLPPLVPTNSLKQRRGSVESGLAEKRSFAEGSNSVSGASNSESRVVQSHQRAVSELTSWKCRQCHKTFTQRVALQMHACPSPPSKPFQCGQCSSTFNNSSELRAHVASHTTERPFKCGFCSRTFVGATTLNNHVRTHMGHKPFACEKCGKTFSQAMHLAKHTRESCKYESSSSGSDTITQQPVMS